MTKRQELTPKELTAHLDRYIIGQENAKRAVAVAIRNRYRRSLLSDEEKSEIIPKNILMIGPTGVGKTEIARRIAKLVNAPFIKVEATKFTEVGYVGRDVESMIRDLTEAGVRIVREEQREAVKEQCGYCLLKNGWSNCLFPKRRKRVACKTRLKCCSGKKPNRMSRIMQKLRK